MRKITISSLVIVGILMAFSQVALADPGPPGVPDAGSTALLLTGSIACIAMVRRTFGGKK